MRKELMGSRWFGLGARQDIEDSQAITYGLRCIEPAFEPVFLKCPGYSRALAIPLLRASLRWAFDLPGTPAPWGLFQTIAARMYELLDEFPKGLGTYGRSGPERYIYAEQLPAVVLACLCVDELAELSRYQVQVLDAKTEARHIWTMWSGPFLPMLLAHQTRGALPGYVTLAHAAPVWQPDRAMLAAWLIPELFWRSLDPGIKRLLATYLAEPRETLTPLHEFLQDTPSNAIVYIDLILLHALRDKLGINKVPGHIFVLPEMTFFAQARVLQVLSDATGERTEDILLTLKASRLVLPDTYSLSLPDVSRPRPITLQGFCAPHAVLQMRCASLGLAYDGLPWATDPPVLYASAATLALATLQKEDMVYATDHS